MSGAYGGSGGWDAPGGGESSGLPPAPYGASGGMPPVYGGTPDPYATPAQYGAPPPAYGYAPPPGYGPPPLPPGVSYASWGSRALALVVDSLMLFVCVTPGVVFTAVAASQAGPGEDPTVAEGVTIAVLFLAGVAGWLYNFCWTQGKRGQSWGKRVVGIHLVREYDLAPPGGGMGVARYVLRSALGNATCGIYSFLTALWPLWDDKNQTIDDKILHTLVVRRPR
jgi:uncharacterized RDD family membrane protein YckC